MLLFLHTFPNGPQPNFKNWFDIMALNVHIDYGGAGHLLKCYVTFLSNKFSCPCSISWDEVDSNLVSFIFDFQHVCCQSVIMTDPIWKKTYGGIFNSCSMQKKICSKICIKKFSKKQQKYVNHILKDSPSCSLSVQLQANSMCYLLLPQNKSGNNK